ncbi:MAG: hypothetical protein DSM106950_41245 [Stigonema ocellatum SAG 48.90 = DSM 106950]|nr:hypothetical protein [Stigonema ocellatum SAG 48.90 = DSM 106950]
MGRGEGGKGGGGEGGKGGVGEGKLYLKLFPYTPKPPHPYEEQFIPKFSNVVDGTEKTVMSAGFQFKIGD